MKITRENYESFFIDLIDGNLANNELDEILDFMRENPDLAEELKGLEKVKIEVDEDLKYSSDSLIKTDFDHAYIFEETCIRSIENELTEQEEIKFQKYLLANKKAKNEYRLFKSTISEPDTLIEFSKKDSLIHNRTILPYWYAYVAVLLIGFLFWFNFNKTTTINEVAIVIPLNETPKVELVMEYYKPTLAKLNEVQPKEKYFSIVPKIEYTPREIESLALLSSISVQVRNNLKVSEKLKSVPVVHPNQEIYPDLGEYLAVEISKIDPKEEVNNLAQVALNKLKDVSNDKLSYDTTSEGKVKKIEFNSRLLAFSFPVNSK